MWDVNNPKGRISSILSVITWVLLMALLIIKGEWTNYTILMMVLFALLLALSFVRIVQEWKEDGVWLE